MWIVRLALRRPYTFTVVAMLLVLMGIVTIARMSTDIFPSINIPVVSVIWSFSGVAPEEMEKRFVTVCERAMTTTVNDIEHIESQSYNGVAVIKVFFHEGAKVEAGVAQITSICQTLLRIMPPGTTPPLIIQYSASNVPILQLGLSSKTLSEQQLYDLGLNFIRTQLATVQGAQVPLPYGGKSRQVMVDIDPQKLFGKGLSPADVSTALNAQNVILPAGTQKIGDREYNVRLNSSPEVLQVLNDLPIKQVNGAFFFSSRGRHTRSTRDWSSDVCSSDLPSSARRVIGRGPVRVGRCRFDSRSLPIRCGPRTTHRTSRPSCRPDTRQFGPQVTSIRACS